MTITNTWASAPSAPITTPNAATQTNGFVCGPADPGLFNWLFREVTAAIRDFTTRIAATETKANRGIGDASTFTAGTIN